MPFLTIDDLQPVIAGDARSLGQFYDEFASLVAILARTVNNKCVAWQSWEDVQMELWESILHDSCRLLRRYRGDAPFPHYLAACLKRRCIDIARSVSSESARRAGKDQDREQAGVWFERLQDEMAKEAAEDEHEQRIEEERTGERRATLARVIERFDPETRLFLKMLVLDSCALEVVMKAFNITSRATVYTRKHRLMEKLRLLMEEDMRRRDGVAEDRRPL